MRRYRIRIALLALGAIVGYGSAFAQGLHGHHHHCHASGERDFGWGRDYHDEREPHDRAREPSVGSQRNGT
jgi:hypothetical protein